MVTSTRGVALFNVMPLSSDGKSSRIIIGMSRVRIAEGRPVHHDQARLWFGSAAPNDHALRVLQGTALRPLQNQLVTGGPLEWDAAPYPRLATLMNLSIMRASRSICGLQFPL